MYANIERYFHISGFAEHPGAVEYGDLLQFDTIPTPKGLRAVRIELIPCDLPAEAADHAG